MKTGRMLHRALPIALLLVVLPGALLAKDDKPAAVPSMRVAIFPYLNTTEELGAAKIMGDIMRDQLKKVEAARATFLWPDDVERLLTDSNEMARIDKITDRWATSGILDTTSVAGLESMLMVDAILLVRVKEWENHRVPVVGAGQSSATVALSFALYDVRTDKLLWTKSPREQRFSAEMDASSTSVNYDETGVIQRKSDNAPPRYESVAGDLIRDAFKKFPRG